METATTKYLGELRTETTHVRSGKSLLPMHLWIIKGGGNIFHRLIWSLQRLEAAFYTIMGIAAREHGFSITAVHAGSRR